ncbi:MAG: type IV toxin-antitoxin system AbiEi family antitoxin [Dermatophilaceae bacterium]
MPELAPEVLDLLARQDRVATRAQLLALGVSDDVVRWNAGRGWRVLLPCTYLLGDTTSERRRHVAALLWAGERSVLGGATAARWHGVSAADPRDRVHVVVPAPQRSRRSGFTEVRRSLLVDHEVVTRGPVRVSSPARAVVDAAVAVGSADTRSAILIEAVQRRLATVDEVAEWVHRLRPRDAARVRPALDDAATGAWSLPEAQVLDLVSGSAVLPAPWANPRLETSERVLTTPDVWFDDVAMSVMVHSRRHHSDGDDFDATVEADADLVAAGVVVVGVTPRRLRQAPDKVLARLERTYESAARRPRPAVQATPRHLLGRGRPGCAS